MTRDKHTTESDEGPFSKEQHLQHSTADTHLNPVGTEATNQTPGNLHYKPSTLQQFCCGVPLNRIQQQNNKRERLQPQTPRIKLL